MTVAGLSALQMGLGFVNVLLLAPVSMQLVHLLVADLLWIALVRLAALALARGAPADVPVDVPALVPGGTGFDARRSG
jgi:heme A synthase